MAHSRTEWWLKHTGQVAHLPQDYSADEKITETADESNKYDYQANRNFIIGSLTINLPKILCNVFKLSKIENIYIEATRCKSQIIPRRSFPRRKNKMSCRKHYGNRKVTR